MAGEKAKPGSKTAIKSDKKVGAQDGGRNAGQPSRKRATSDGGGADWARKRLKDGKEGRPGSLSVLLTKITDLKKKVCGMMNIARTMHRLSQVKQLLILSMRFSSYVVLEVL